MKIFLQICKEIKNRIKKQGKSNKMFKHFLMKALFSDTEVEWEKYLKEIEGFTFKIHIEEGNKCNHFLKTI